MTILPLVLKCTPYKKKRLIENWEKKEGLKKEGERGVRGQRGLWNPILES